MSKNLSSNYSVLPLNRQSKDKNHQIDLVKPSNFNYDILNNAEYILFCAAISNPDICFDQYKLAYNINVVGTKYFIAEALNRQCRIIFLSSDVVYGDNKNVVCNETTPTCDMTPYGIMKKEIEDCFKYNINFKSIRLSYVISKDDKFTKYIFDCNNKKKIAEVYHPFYRNCIFIDDVLNSIVWIMRNWSKFGSSFLNVCGRELISRVRIIDEINRIDGFHIPYDIIRENNFFLNRHKIIEMTSLYLKDILDDWNEPFSTGLKRMLLS